MKQVKICERGLLDFMSYIFVSVSSVEKTQKAVFHSVKIFAWADFLELKILRGKINFHFPGGHKNKKDIKIALYQQYYKSHYVN